MITRKDLDLGWITIGMYDTSKMDGVAEAPHALAKLRQGQVRDVLQVLHGSTSPPPEGAMTKLDGSNMAFAEHKQ